MLTGFEPTRFDDREAWPELPYRDWVPTIHTVHRWTQIIGKVKLVLSPPLNHFWHAGLTVSPIGLTTSAIPIGPDALELEFDFLRHNLHLRTSSGAEKVVPLLPRTVSGFYREVMSALQALGLDVRIRALPDEVTEERIPFEEDDFHHAYDADAVHRFHRALLTASSLLAGVRSRFLGKASPVNFYWGSFDLALSFYSGRRAPERPDADAITRGSYTHEVISVGFWPGDARLPEPAFYGYSVPQPSGFAQAPLVPEAAQYNEKLGEFILPWARVREEASPSSAVIAFCEGVLDAGASLGGWDREALFGQVPTTAAEVAPPPAP